MNAPDAPLAGLRVVEIGRFVAAPLTSQALALLGADVVKVEPAPVGDPTRRVGRRDQGGAAAVFNAFNSDKSSVVLDLRSDEGKAALAGLVGGADLLVENFSSGRILDELLDLPGLLADHPRLVHIGVRGYFDQPGDGAPVPPATDPVIQSVTGMLDQTGPSTGEPALAGAPVSDITAGLLAAVTFLSLRHLADRTDMPAEQRSAEVSLAGAGYLALASRLQMQLASPEPLVRQGAGHDGFVPYNTYPASDGTVFVAVSDDRQWGRLVEALASTLPPDDAWSEGVRRLESRTAVDLWVAGATASWSRDDLVKRLLDAHVVAAPVLTVAESLTSPLLAANIPVRHVLGADGTSALTLMGLPVQIDDGMPFAPTRGVPAAGEDRPTGKRSR